MAPRFPHLKINHLICFFITESNQTTSSTCYLNSLKMSKMFTNTKQFKGRWIFVMGSFSKIWKVKIINEKRIWTGMLTLNSTLVFGNGGRRQAGLTTQFFSASFSLYCLFFRFILAYPLLYVLSKFPMKPEFKGLVLNWIQNYWKCLNTSQKLRRKDSLIFLNVGIHGLSHHLKNMNKSSNVFLP